MKNELKFQYENLKCVFETSKFKLVLLLLFITAFYGSTVLALEKDYIDGFLSATTGAYYVLFMLIIMLIHTINVYNIFEQNQFYLIRFQNKKRYLKHLILTILFENTVLIILSFLLLIIGLNLLCSMSLGIHQMGNYNISNFIYLIFYLLRFYFLFQMISIFSILLFKIFGQKIVIGCHLILYATLFSYSYQPQTVITSIVKMPKYIGEYFTIYLYQTFELEVMCSILYLCIFGIILSGLFVFISKSMKQVGE